MPDLLPLFWPLINAEDPVFTPRFTAKWPDGALAHLVELGIVAGTQDADCILCPECYEHDEEIIPLEGADGQIRYMIPCPAAFHVEIPPGQLRQWVVKRSSVARHLARCLHLVGQPNELGSDRMWRLGRGTFGDYLHDVLFVCRSAKQETDLLAAISTALRPIVLFTGDVPTERWWQDHKVPSASLPEIATCSESGLAVDRAVLDALVTQSDDRASRNTFRRRGEFWELTFGGATVHLKDSVGLSYIARLLREPQRSIPAVSLFAMRVGIDPAVATGSAGEVLDETARLNYSRRYQELSEELEAVTANHDHGTLEKLQQEMDLLVSELARATGLGGRSRQQTDADRIRRSVTMAVSRDLDRIAKEHAALGQHLLGSITSGLTFRYSPQGEVFSWLT